MKKTKWFSPYVKPARPGIYETNFYGCPGWFAYWNGKSWGTAESTILKANKERSPVGASQDKGWRGLTTKDGK